MLVLSEPSQGGKLDEKRRSGLPMVLPEHTRKHSWCLPWETDTVERKFTVYFRHEKTFDYSRLINVNADRKVEICYSAC